MTTAPTDAERALPYFAAQPALGPEEQLWPCCLEDIVPLCDPPKNPSERALFLAITLCTFARFGGPSCHSTLTLMGSIARVHPEFGKALAVVPPTYDACLQHLNHARGFLDKAVAVVLFFAFISIGADSEEDVKNTENFKYVLAGYRERIDKFAAAAADVLRIVELPVLAARLPNKQAELEVVKGWCETIIDLRSRRWKQKFSSLFGKLAEVYASDTCLFVECPDPNSKGSNLCSGCGVVRYCSKECQTKAWKYAEAPHSTLCKAIKKLRAAPAVSLTVAEDWHGSLREPHSEQCNAIVEKCVKEPPADSDKLVREIWSGAAVPAALDSHLLQSIIMADEPTRTLQQSRLASINGQIVSLEQQLEALRAEQSELLFAMDPAYTIVPTEIILHIFSLAIGFPQLGRRHGYRETGPLLLKAVCRDWHALVCNAPELWSRLHIVQSRTSSKSNKFFNRLRAYLARSGQRPLDLRITFGSSWGVGEMMAVLEGYLSRVQTLHLERTMDGFVMDQLQNHLPAVQRLRVSRNGVPGHQPWRVLATLSGLTHAEIDTPRIDTLQLPWKQLTYLCLVVESHAASHLVRVLGAASALETLAMIDVGGALQVLDALAEHESRRGILPGLQHLVIRHSASQSHGGRGAAWGSATHPGRNITVLQRLMQERFTDVRVPGVKKLQSLRVVLSSFNRDRRGWANFDLPSPENELQLVRDALDQFKKQGLALEIGLIVEPLELNPHDEDRSSGEWGAEYYIHRAMSPY
uniref:MYND-type domain-containing protein n=1 Tax=Mycena chlorophos TaxID=658473 RepID=A0ABQ0LYR8_MYCCL|nr:predicted protein [Mycena chlorophos]